MGANNEENRYNYSDTSHTSSEGNSGLLPRSAQAAPAPEAVVRLIVDGGDQIEKKLAGMDDYPCYGIDRRL